MKMKTIVLVCIMIFLSPLRLNAAEPISVFDEAVSVKDNLEPVIPRPEQEKITNKKLKDLEAKTGKKPNILIFLADDLGWGDIGVNGGGIAVGAPTPNIDTLSRDGLRLTSFYASPLCTPSRAMMMTGRLPFRSGLTRPLLAGDKITSNPWKIEVAQAKLLSDAGYKTALIGKWHIGDGEDMLPHEVGFDYFFGLPGVQTDYTQFLVEREYSDMINNKEIHDKAFQLQPKGLITGKKGGKREVGFAINNLSDLRQTDQILKKESIKFINENSGGKAPFFLIHSFTAIHNDTYCAEDYIGRSPAAMPVKDALVEMDDIVGEIMAVVEKSGELENTLVIFVSDNGANEDVFPDSGYQPWRGGKGSTWEGGVRVPFIANWKGMIEPGQESNELMDLTDVYMVALRVAGITTDALPKKLYYDGIDQTSFLLTKNGRSLRQTVFLYTMMDLTAIRWKDYKIHFQISDTKDARRNLDASLLSRTAYPWIFNLNVDPKEQASEGHRWFEWGLPAVLAFQKRHLETVKKYPNTDLGLAL